MIKWTLFFFAGGAGTLARFFLSSFIARMSGGKFPYGTLAVNLLGCFIIGALMTLTETKLQFSQNVRLWLMAGFVGAFTTFSTFILETFNLAQDGRFFLALSNILVSVVVGFVLFYIGAQTAKLI